MLVSIAVLTSESSLHLLFASPVQLENFSLVIEHE